MKKLTVMKYVFITTAALDVIALLIPAGKADFFLRPLTLIFLLLYSIISGAEFKIPSIIIRAGLFFALLVEILQRLGMAIEYVIIGTALYYFLYMLAFLIRGGWKLDWRRIIPFAVIGLYALLLFIWFEPYGFLRNASMVYLIVVVAMTGLAMQAVAQKDFSPLALWMAGGAALLLLSDSIRAFTIFKSEFFRSEAVILALYFAGQFGIVRSMLRKDNAHAP